MWIPKIEKAEILKDCGLTDRVVELHLNPPCFKRRYTVVRGLAINKLKTDKRMIIMASTIGKDDL